VEGNHLAVVIPYPATDKEIPECFKFLAIGVKQELRLAGKNTVLTFMTFLLTCCENYQRITGLFFIF